MEFTICRFRLRFRWSSTGTLFFAFVDKRGVGVILIWWAAVLIAVLAAGCVLRWFAFVPPVLSVFAESNGPAPSYVGRGTLPFCLLHILGSEEVLFSMMMPASAMMAFNSGL